MLYSGIILIIIAVLSIMLYGYKNGNHININPLSSFKVKQKCKKSEKNLQQILHNIDIYDGTDNGQEEVI